MITQNQYDLLKTKFGDVASWAIWREPNLNIGAKSNISDLSIFESPDILNILNPNCVFVGLNAAMHKKVEYRSWMSFHSSDARRSQDYKLRDVLKDTPLWGGYITDIIKYYPETFSDKVISHIKHNPKILDENIAVFQKEIDILGTNPVLFALGKNTYDLLMQSSLARRFTIKRITHYSATISKQAYRDEIQKVINELNLSI